MTIPVIISLQNNSAADPQALTRFAGLSQVFGQAFGQVFGQLFSRAGSLLQVFP